MGHPCWYGLLLTEGVADTNTLTAMGEVVDHPLQGGILQAEVLQFLEETGVPDSVESLREIKKASCDGKTFISALGNLVHESGELEFGAIIGTKTGLVHWEEGCDVLVESLVDDPLLHFTDNAEKWYGPVVCYQ